MPRKGFHSVALLLLLFLVNLAYAGCCIAKEQSKTGGKQGVEQSAGSPQRLVKGGISVEAHIDPIAGKGGSKELVEGEDALIQFKITDSTTGASMSGIRPAVWIDPMREKMDLAQGESRSSTCEDKIKLFMQGSLSFQPALNLNTYYILALNDKENISVIDPMLGLYTSKLITYIQLKSPGEDWALTRDSKKLFVTMPKVHQVAVVNTETWKVTSDVEAGRNLGRVALQPDEKYVWVGNDGSGKAESGVTVIDSGSARVVARIPTGVGRHEIAFSDDSRYAFVTNREAGTLSVVDVRNLKAVKEIKIGPDPVSMAFSKMSKALYVAHESEGKISVIDGKEHKVIATIEAKPGLRSIRCAPDGRWVLAANQRENTVSVVDSSVNRITHTIGVETRPDQISFSPAFAYIRCAGSDQVSAIQLSMLGKEENVPAIKFPSGRPPQDYPNPGPADVIVPTPEGDTVLIANPVEKTVYYYMEGMLAPMGNFQNYGREPRAILIVDRSLRETAQGTYSTAFKLPSSGKYDVAFLVDTPLTYHCFSMDVEPNPLLEKKGELPLRVEYLNKDEQISAGQTTRLLFELTDPKTNQARADIKDLRVMFMLVPGVWQSRVWATPVGGGLYEAEMTVPRAGLYHIFVECPSLDLRFGQLPHLMVRVTDGGQAGEAAKGSGVQGVPSPPSSPAQGEEGPRQ